MRADGEAVPGDLRRFMETFAAPPGETPLSVLQRYDPLLNGGGPQIEARRKVPIAEIDSWRLTADVYPARAPAPLLVFFHGGGWVMGNPGTHDRMAREFADAGLLTVSVDYPRAPRWRFPAAVEAAVASVHWAIEHAAEHGSDGSRVAVAGDSAGANLAAAVLATATLPVAAAVLMYGIYDFHRALPSLAPLIGGTDADAQLYLAPEQFDTLVGDPRLSPERAADRFPPSWLGVGDRDPLLPETLALAEALARAGVAHELHVAVNAPHSYLQMPFHEAYATGHRSMQQFLHRHLRHP